MLYLFLQLITEQASFTLPRSAEIDGKCGSTESEIHITWKNNAFTLRIYFSKVSGNACDELYFILKSWNNLVRISTLPHIAIHPKSTAQVVTNWMPLGFLFLYWNEWEWSLDQTLTPKAELCSFDCRENSWKILFKIIILSTQMTIMQCTKRVWTVNGSLMTSVAECRPTWPLHAVGKIWRACVCVAGGPRQGYWSVED